MRGAAAIVAACLVLAGCGGTQSPRQSLAAWATASHLGEAAGALLTDAAQLHAVIAARREAKVVRTVCAELLNDAQGANDELPTPDAQLTGLLSNAYGRLAHAANACFNAAADPAALRGADAQRRAAVGVLVSAVLRAEAVLGRSLSVRDVP